MNWSAQDGLYGVWGLGLLKYEEGLEMRKEMEEYNRRKGDVR